MKTIHKFPLAITASQSVAMPSNAKILSVQLQNEVPCLLAQVDTNYDLEKRHIVIYGTVDPMDQLLDHSFIGTIQLQGGTLIFHVFEII